MEIADTVCRSKRGLTVAVISTHMCVLIYVYTYVTDKISLKINRPYIEDYMKFIQMLQNVVK